MDEEEIIDQALQDLKDTEQWPDWEGYGSRIEGNYVIFTKNKLVNATEEEQLELNFVKKWVVDDSVEEIEWSIS